MTTIIPAKAVVPFLVAMMLLTGVCNTLLTKYQDNQCVRNCDDPDPKKRAHFEQPVYQTAQMFVGESGSWLVIAGMSLWRRYVTRGDAGRQGYQAVSTGEAEAEITAGASEASPLTGTAPNKPDDEDDGSAVLKGFRIFLLSLPAICDILGTTLMNVGLLFVAASIYQMTRGALVLFVGLFSVVFLRRHLHLFQWLSLVGVVVGVAVVGLAGAIHPDANKAAGGSTDQEAADASADAVRTVIGVLLIAGAQIFTATQFVLEEWVLERSAIEPLRVVGWEGLFGLVTTMLAMVVLHLVVGRTEAGRYGFFDMVEGWRQMTQNPQVAVSSILIMISILGFNFFGLSVTRNVSATARSTIDTCRTLFIWLVSLGLGWESFKWLQVLGFVLLVYFTFLFNGIVQPPLEWLRVEEVEELLPEEPVEHF